MLNLHGYLFKERDAQLVFLPEMPEMEMANSWGSLCAIYLSRVFSRLPQTGQELIDSMSHLWAICMIENQNFL